MFRYLILLICCSFIISCKTAQKIKIKDAEVSTAELEKFKIEGRILKKGMLDNFEAWIANRRPYYVLDVAGASFVKYTAEQGMILYPAGEMSYDTFESFVNKRVEAYGAYVPKEAYMKNPSQYDEQDKLRYQGEGYLVFELKIMR